MFILESLQELLLLQTAIAVNVASSKNLVRFRDGFLLLASNLLHRIVALQYCLVERVFHDDCHDHVHDCKRGDRHEEKDGADHGRIKEMAEFRVQANKWPGDLRPPLKS